MTRKTRASSSYVGWVFRAFDKIAPPADELLLLLLLTSVGRNGGAGRKLTMLQLAAANAKWRIKLINTENVKGGSDGRWMCTFQIVSCAVRRCRHLVDALVPHVDLTVRIVFAVA